MPTAAVRALRGILPADGVRRQDRRAKVGRLALHRRRDRRRPRSAHRSSRLARFSNLPLTVALLGCLAPALELQAAASAVARRVDHVDGVRRRSSRTDDSRSERRDAHVVGWGSAPVHARVRRSQPLYRAAFSVASVAITVQTAGLVWQHSRRQTRQDQPSVPLAATTATYFLVNTGLVATAIGLSNGLSPLRAWYWEFFWSAPSYFLSGAAAGVVGLIVIHEEYLLLPSALVPLYVSYRAYQLSLQQNRRRAPARRRALARGRHDTDGARSRTAVGSGSWLPKRSDWSSRARGCR